MLKAASERVRLFSASPIVRSGSPAAIVRVRSGSPVAIVRVRSGSPAAIVRVRSGSGECACSAADSDAGLCWVRGLEKGRVVLFAIAHL